MNYGFSDLGHRSGGEMVEVTLSVSANVRLLDTANYSNYRRGRKHRYYGGHVTRSPYRIAIPHSGHWYVVVDLGGYAGRVRWSARVLPGALPPARPAVPFGYGDQVETAADLVEYDQLVTDRPEAADPEEKVS